MKLGKLKEYKSRDRRMKRKFALFPKALSNDEVIWLEFYYSYQEYKLTGTSLGRAGQGCYFSWIEDYSCSTKKQLKDRLLLDYRENKRIKKGTDDFFKYLEERVKLNE